MLSTPVVTVHDLDEQDNLGRSGIETAQLTTKMGQGWPQIILS